MYTISIGHEQILQKMWFLHTLKAVLGSHGNVEKCTAAIFFLTEDCNYTVEHLVAAISSKQSLLPSE